MTRIAYLIMAYKNPSQIERLISTLASSGVHFYIHLDKKFDIEPFAYLKKKDSVFFIKNRELVNWGTYSLTRAILSSLKEVLEGSIVYPHFAFISGQDYPIQPVEDLYKLLDKNQEVNLISYLPQNHAWYKEAQLRTQFYFCNELPFVGKYKLESFLNFFFRRFRYKYPSPLYGAPGSTFMILSRECSLFILDKINNNLGLKFHLELTWGPDEFIFQTLIMHSEFKTKVLPNIIYYMNWKDGGLHPKTFTYTDLEELQTRPEFFARKFDEEMDTVIMDLLDSKIKSESSII